MESVQKFGAFQTFYKIGLENKKFTEKVRDFQKISAIFRKNSEFFRKIFRDSHTF